MKREELSYKILTISVVCFILIFSSCRSTKKVGHGEPAEFKEKKEILSALQEHNPDFRTLSARLNVDLRMTDREMGSRVDLKMVKDSLILLSVQPLLGIEVFRLELTTDSVKFVDRMGKQYIAENYSVMQKQWKVDFDFYSLQALFLNRIFMPGERELIPEYYNRFRMRRNNNDVEFVSKDRAGLIYKFDVDREYKLLNSSISENEGRFKLLWSYYDFQSLEGKLFPYKGDVNIYVEGNDIGGLRISYSRIQLNRDLKLGAGIPSKYQRISADKLLKFLNVQI